MITLGVLAALTWGAIDVASPAPATPASTTPAPSPQDLLFFNARIALREGRSHDVLRLWLLRNVVTHERGAGKHDDDFRSVVWAALGNLGACPDGFPEDIPDDDAAMADAAGGAGLWQVAEHNLLLHQVRAGHGLEPPPPWDAFKVARQRRWVSLHDVLSKEELANAAFTRTGPTPCLQPYFTFARFPTLEVPDWRDRLFVGRLMKRLLEQAKQAASTKKVASTALIDARLFDLSLDLAKLEAVRAKQRAGRMAQLAHSVGLPDSAVDDVTAAFSAPPQGSEARAFLLRALGWRPEEWLDLSPDRRVSLFTQAKAAAEGDAARGIESGPVGTKLDPITIGIIDALIAQGDGGQAEGFIGLTTASTDANADTRSAIVGGDRGLLLLALDPASGFRQRAVVALHRGVHFLEAGARDDALRSFAFAVGHAHEARDGAATHNLALRWLTYVLAQYQSTAEVVSTLQELLSRADYHRVVEELVWRAALRADPTSFDRLEASVQSGGSLSARIADLRPLAHGNAGALVDAQRARSQDEPTAVTKFLDELVTQLERESADVRDTHRPTLQLVGGLAREIEAREGDGGAARKARALLHRIDAVLEGLGGAGAASEPGADTRGMGERRAAYAGAIRLAPSDPLPWPFVAPQADAPSAFRPIVARPEEWRAPDGSLVFGFRLTE